MNVKLKLNQDKTFDIINNTILLLLGLVILYPLWYVLIASISNPVYISSGRVTLWPRGLTTIAYKALFENSRIWIGYRNSLFYTVTGTVLNLLITLPCAYALSRESLPGKKGLFFFFTLTMYFTGGTMPTYLWMNQLRLINTVWIMILPHGIGVFNLLIARTFFKDNIPEALFDSARIDGASVTRFFVSIVIPISKPIIAVLTLFYALSRWNAYFDAMIYIRDNKLQTLQVIIRDITANIDATVAESMDPAELDLAHQQQQLLKYAVVVVSAIPMMLLYPFIQKYFITGIMLGSIKE